VRANFKQHLEQLTHLAGSVDDGDAALLRTTRAALEGAPLPAWEKAVAHASADVVEQALEASLVRGDIATAEAVAKHAPANAPANIAADLARVRVLRALPDAQRARAVEAINANRSKIKENLPGTVLLALGELHADFARHPLPFVMYPSPLVFPERRLQRLLADATVDPKTLPQRFIALEQLALVDHALTVDDLAATTAPLKAAREAMGGTPEVLLVEASVTARRGNVIDARKSLEAAVLAAPLDPAVLMQASQALLALDDVDGARRALQAFGRLGFTSPTASALTAQLALRSGDLATARSALADAKRLGGDDDLDVLRATILAHRSTTITAARAAADKLLAHNDVDGGRVVTAWIADAAWRAGDHAKATALLEPLMGAVLSSASNDFPDLHFFYAQTIAFVPQQKSMALAEVAKAEKGLVGSELLPEVKTLQALLAKKPK
jgi:Flp pilus assembly protein TadD